ncbi:hypothetical protein Bca4012_005177 [Brassica carinata]|uniref:Zinc finger PHD-type domain-containing protein n=1 Tax=Brassica carinata TaxID=52824 RepID=A0A8X7RTG5_BRACI|nr:hypothetical protein Bca52824_040406 [Brassica carinata]
MGYRQFDHYPLRHIQEKPSCLRRNGVCTFCKNEVLESNAFYCHTCWSHYHKDCLTITYPKIHNHTLTFIHRNNAFTCDACGFVLEKQVNMFACLQCDFFVHRECIFLPKVIKITRHSHYLSHTLCIPDGNLICKICRNHRIKLKPGYGGYTCIDNSCDYVAHSDCATLKDVWDGRDHHIEGHEEDSNSEADLAALVDINGKSMRHFSHDHDLLVSDVERGEKEDGYVCQACILPIEFGRFLACKECDFALHEACGSLPRKMENSLHPHSLILQIDMMNIEEGFFTCSVCLRESCGFMYQCSQKDCGFQMDVNCASFADPLNHIAHPPHLLFYTSSNYEYSCMGCDQRSKNVVHCPTCYFPLDFKCVTLPRLVKYKHDVHPLTLYCDKSNTRFEKLSWCEICEEKINVKMLYYICHDCITTLHIGCMIGKYPYLKPSHRIKVDGVTIQITTNSSVSRSICHTCHRICQDKLVFMISGKDVCFCSLDCVH